MRLVFDYVPDDFAALGEVMADAPPSRRPGTRRYNGGWVLFVGLALVLVYVQRQHGGPSSGGDRLFFGGLIVAGLSVAIAPPVLRAAVRFVNRRLAGRHFGGGPLTTCDVTADGIANAVGPIQTHWGWDAFDRFTETDGHVFLHLRAGRNRWVMLPLRGLTDPAERPALRHLLATHVGPSAAGFPIAPSARPPT